MLVKRKGILELCQGKLLTHPGSGLPVIVDAAGRPLGAEVEYLIPDDERQGDQLRAKGFPVHTPLSMCLGAGSTHPGDGSR